MPALTKQEKKVYDFIKANPGCTTRDIINGTYVTCPSGRITEMRSKGVPIVSIGQKRYAGARAFEMYAIKAPDQQVAAKKAQLFDAGAPAEQIFSV